MENIQRLERQAGAMQTVFDITVLETQDRATFDGWAAADEVSTARVKLLSAGVRYQLSDEPFDDGRSGMAPSDAGMTQWWNGEVWQEWYPAMNTHRLEKQPRLGYAMDAVAFFNCSDWSSFVSHEVLSDVIARSTLLDHAELGDGAERWRFVTNSTGSAYLTMETASEPDFIIRRVTHHGIPAEAHGDEGEAVFKIEFIVSEWARYNGALLPSVGLRDSENFRKKQVGRTRFQRRSLDMLDPEHAWDNATIHTPQQGDLVRDQRLSLRYRIGSDEISIDDHDFRTTEPIDGIVFDEFPTLIHPEDTGSQSAMAPQQSRPDYESSSDSGPVPVRLVLAIGVLVFGGLLGVATLARNARRESSKHAAI